MNMRLAKMSEDKDKIEVPMQQEAPDGSMMTREKGVLGEFGDLAKQKAMQGMLEYGTGQMMGTAGSAAAMNPYVAGGILGAKALGLFSGGGKAQGSMNPIVSSIMDRAELMETENQLINDYENIKRYLYGGGKVKYYQEGTEMPVPYPRPLIGNLNESGIPMEGMDGTYGLPSSLNENADILAMTNLPEFVQRAADSRSPSLIGEGGGAQSMQTVDYEVDGKQRLAPTIRVDKEMNQAYQMNPDDAIKAAERTGDFATVPTDRGYSAKEFSDLLSAYIGKLRKDSTDT